MSVATSISENHFLCFVSPSSDSMQFRSPPPWNSWYNWFKKKSSPTVLCRVLTTSQCLWDSTNRVLVTGHSRACQCASSVWDGERGHMWGGGGGGRGLSSAESLISRHWRADCLPAQTAHGIYRAATHTRLYTLSDVCMWLVSQSHTVQQDDTK